jgi:hypothetical protein
VDINEHDEEFKVVIEHGKFSDFLVEVLRIGLFDGPYVVLIVIVEILLKLKFIKRLSSLRYGMHLCNFSYDYYLLLF